MTKPMESTSVAAPGAEQRRIYIDAIDEAMQRRASSTMRPKPPRRPRRQMNDIALRQLKQAEKLQRLMGRTIAEATTVDTQFVTAFNKLTSTITNAMEQIRRGHKAEKEAMSGLSDQQLDDVLRAHLPRLATQMDEQERRLMLALWFGEDVADVLLKPRTVAAHDPGAVICNGCPGCAPEATP